MTQTNTFNATDKTWTVTEKCDVCHTKISHEGVPNGTLPSAALHAHAGFKAKGWRIGKAIPIKRMSVTEKDELGKPIKTEMIDSTMDGTACPECAEKIK